MASNGTDTPALLPGQSPPLTVLTPTDQTGVLYITTAIGLVFAVISLLIRYFIRVDLQNKLSADDIVASLALVFFLMLILAVMGLIVIGVRNCPVRNSFCGSCKGFRKDY